VLLASEICRPWSTTARASVVGVHAQALPCGKTAQAGSARSVTAVQAISSRCAPDVWLSEM
jgi:hypothetical protein